MERVPSYYIPLHSIFVNSNNETYLFTTPFRFIPSHTSNQNKELGTSNLLDSKFRLTVFVCQIQPGCSFFTNFFLVRWEILRFLKRNEQLSN